jgi:hypothetical protein
MSISKIPGVQPSKEVEQSEGQESNKRIEIESTDLSSVPEATKVDTESMVSSVVKKRKEDSSEQQISHDLLEQV